MSDELEAQEYSVPAFDCPACGAVNARFGADSCKDVETCDYCREEVVVS